MSILTFCRCCGGSIDAVWIPGRSFYWLGGEGGDAVCTDWPLHLPSPLRRPRPNPTRPTIERYNEQPSTRRR